MYIKLVNQAQIVQKAIDKAGSYRQLSKILGIPRSSLCNYVRRDSVIPEENSNKILDYLEVIDKNKVILKRLEDNFKQKIGGANCVASKRKKGILDENLKKMRDVQSIRLKNWHKSMKKDNPLEYYKIQYSRFKKIGGYKYLTKNGEKVRNKLEKEVADLLYRLKIDYEYEPLINVGVNYFFPDFLINKDIILECTMWKGEQKAYKLRDKIDILSNKYRVFVVIPKPLYIYYRVLNKEHLILGLDELVSVAQTF